MTIATAQLAVGCVYGVFLWVAPDARKAPTITLSDFVKMIPAGVCSGMTIFCYVYKYLIIYLA